MKYQLKREDGSVVDELEIPDHLFDVISAVSDFVTDKLEPLDAMHALLLAFRSIVAMSGPLPHQWTVEEEVELARTMRHNFHVCLQDGLERRAVVREEIRKRIATSHELQRAIGQTVN